MDIIFSLLNELVILRIVNKLVLELLPSYPYSLQPKVNTPLLVSIIVWYCPHETYLKIVPFSK